MPGEGSEPEGGEPGERRCGGVGLGPTILEAAAGAKREWPRGEGGTGPVPVPARQGHVWWRRRGPHPPWGCPRGVLSLAQALPLFPAAPRGREGIILAATGRVERWHLPAAVAAGFG